MNENKMLTCFNW